MVAGRATSVREFRGDDAGYLDWLATYPVGYVINIARSHNPADARVHHAGCRWISGQLPHGRTWTGQYVKVCSEQLAEVEQWASDKVGQRIPRCGTCRPGRSAAQPVSPARTVPAGTEPAPDGLYTVQGPVPGSAVVQAWADDYIRFERRPAWQERLRTEIRARCRQLEPSGEQVLHATFFGTKLPNADVENLVAYNIDTFATAARNGIRFEYGAAVPPAPGGGQYRFCYRYALTPRSGAFDHWQQGRTLASFDWTDLGDFAGDTKLAKVWLALARARARGGVEPVEKACVPETPFGVRVQVRPPHGYQPVWGGLLKGIFDGVICAFQAHTDTAVVLEVAARLAAVLPADPAEIEVLLVDRRRAVLGVVPRLVTPYRKGVKWDPTDHLCVAGELLVADAVGECWAIKGEIVELSR